MSALQVPAAVPTPTWSRAAIHDTVAAIARQQPYRRDFGSTLLDRIMRTIGEWYARLFDALGGVPHGRVIATTATVLIALLILARLFYAARLRATPGVGAQVGRSKARLSTDPWREAEELASGGHYTEAVHSLYRGTLAMLGANGLVRLHDSKTSGDYARELRRRGAAAHAAFRRFGARYDRIIYGTGVCDAASYAGLLEDARAVAAARLGERAA